MGVNDIFIFRLIYEYFEIMAVFHNMMESEYSVYLLSLMEYSWHFMGVNGI